MKKLTFYLGAILLIILFSNCKDDKDSDEDILQNAEFYLFKDGQDSVVFKLDVRDSWLNFSSLSIYRKDDAGKYISVEYTSSNNFQLQKDEKGKYFLLKNSEISKKIYYQLNKNILSLFDIQPSMPTVDLYPVTKGEPYYKTDKRILGVWCSVQLVDSVVISFEESEFRQYVFLRGNPNPVSHFYGDLYTTVFTEYKWKGESFDMNLVALSIGHNGIDGTGQMVFINTHYAMTNDAKLSFSSMKFPLRSGVYQQLDVK